MRTPAKNEPFFGINPDIKYPRADWLPSCTLSNRLASPKYVWIRRECMVQSGRWFSFQLQNFHLDVFQWVVNDIRDIRPDDTGNRDETHDEKWSAKHTFRTLTATAWYHKHIASWYFKARIWMFFALKRRLLRDEKLLPGNVAEQVRKSFQILKRDRVGSTLKMDRYAAFTRSGLLCLTTW